MMICFVDVETTGLDADIYQIIQIGAFLYDTQLAKVLGKLEAYIQPDDITKCDQQALRICRYDFDFWEKLSVKKDEAAMRFSAISDKTTLAGHNIHFDERFLRKLLLSNNIRPTWDYHLIDTFSMTLPFTMKRRPHARPSLRVSCEVMGVPYDSGKAHTASYDAQLCIKIFQACVGNDPIGHTRMIVGQEHKLFFDPRKGR